MDVNLWFNFVLDIGPNDSTSLVLLLHKYHIHLYLKNDRLASNCLDPT